MPRCLKCGSNLWWDYSHNDYQCPNCGINGIYYPESNNIKNKVSENKIAGTDWVNYIIVMLIMVVILGVVYIAFNLLIE